MKTTASRIPALCMSQLYRISRLLAAVASIWPKLSFSKVVLKPIKGRPKQLTLEWNRNFVHSIKAKLGLVKSRAFFLQKTKFNSENGSGINDKLFPFL